MKTILVLGLLCAMACVITICVRKFIKYLVASSLLAASITAVLYQVIVYWQLGYLDPFFLVAFVVSWGIALACAIATNAIAKSLSKEK